MPDAIISTATTNSRAGSVVEVNIAEFICTISIERNIFSDTLPVIPSKSRVKEGKVLYRLTLKAELTRHSDEKRITNYFLSFKTNRKNDKISSTGKTDNNGKLSFNLETYEPGDVELAVSSPGVTSPIFKFNLKDAWYESPFLITGYNVCDEADFSGLLVDGNGLNEKHKEDFLFGARGVPMQGTGKITDGHYIALASKDTKWHQNSRGAPDHVMSQETTSFRYVDGVQGKYGQVTENHSIAVDPTVIPPHAQVEIIGLGNRFADDTGGAIKGFHIDNFLGAGDTVVKTWLHGKINGKKLQVKYLGK